MLLQAPTVTAQQLDAVTRGLAQLQDFRLLYYVLIIMVLLLIGERWSAAHGMRKEREQMSGEREKMWAVADKFTDAAKEYTEATDKVVIELQVLRALTARVESNDGRR